MTAADLHLAKDTVLAPLVQKYELPPLTPTDDLYAKLLRNIVFQQLSGKAATTIHKRFLQLFPDEYPDPERLLAFDIEDLRAVGLSRQKANYVQNIARFFIENNIKNADLFAMADEALIEYLSQIKGVGKWTVEMLLMFSMERPDVLPLDDLVVFQQIQKLYGLEGTKRELKKQMTEIAEAWRPYRSTASRYMWASKDA